jgi:hypothetical protein
LGFGGTAIAQIPYPTPGTIIATGDNLYSLGGDVTVTFLGKGNAGDTDLLYLASPTPTAYDSSSSPIFNNQTSAANTTVDLGTFASGTDLEFAIFNEATGNTLYSGSGVNNLDGDVHAYVVNDYDGNPNEEYVGFEDEAAPNSDFNYADVQFVFTGLEGSTSSVPDAASTVSLLGLSLAGVAAMARRFRK